MYARQSKGLWAILFVSSLTLLGCMKDVTKIRAPSAAKWCHGCHGIHGKGTALAAIPNLAGQKVSYLVRQLELFQQGKGIGTAARIQTDEVVRQNRSMKYHADKLGPDEIMATAEFYSSQPCNVRPVNVEPVPSNRCTKCHGDMGISASGGIPNLAGQNIEYLLAQIQKFKESSSGVEREQRRPYRRHPIMSNSVSNLSSGEIATLYAYARMACR